MVTAIHQPCVIMPLETSDNDCNVGKFDLVMWTKNSAKFLPVVLGRIDQVVPKHVVGKKIIVDDHSTDSTIEIAKKFGWTVHPNSGSGFFDAVDTALSHVSTKYFISFEHDIILAKDWWTKISKYTEDDSMAIAQGVRVYTHPVLRKLSEFMINRKDYGFSNFSIDNNIYRTELIKKFKIQIYKGYLDTAKFLMNKGFKWVCDVNVVSEHIRNSLLYFLLHDYKMHHMFLNASQKRNILSKMFRLFLTSPFRALQVSLKKNCPQIFIVYPLDRLLILMACIKF
jgi:glycosyltransferase involved in cell wall biosynthesis